MVVKKLFFECIALLFILICSNAIPQEQSGFSGTLVDTDENTYTLTQLTVSGTTFFHCRLKDAIFTVPFEKISSISFPEAEESPYPGYVLTDLVLTSGTITRIYLNLENYWLEGFEQNLNVRVKFMLTEITSLQIVQPQPNQTPLP